MFKLSLSVSKATPKNKTEALTVIDFTQKEFDITPTSDLRDLLTTRVYSTNYWKNGHCTKSNYLGMYGLTMDIDKDVSIESAKEMFKDFNYIIHTSTSHKADMPKKGGVQDRFRVILPCDPANYGKYADPKIGYALYMALIAKYPFVDTSCAELARKYFPYLNGAYPQLFECYINDTGVYYNIDDKEVDAAIAARKVTAPKRLVKADDIADPNRKYLHRHDELLLVDKVTKKRVSEFREQTAVYCPFCDDINSQSASGLLTFTKAGYPMIHCSHCEGEHKAAGNPQNGKYHLPTNEQFFNIMYIENKLYIVNELKNNVTVGLLPDSHLYGLSTDGQKAFKHWLAHHRYFTSESFTVERKVNGYIDELQWDLLTDEGILDINIPLVPADVKDNDYINNWLDNIFGTYSEFIKDWLAMYCYTNFRPMPILIINGPRGSGKSTFAEFVANLFAGVSMDWKGSNDQFTPYNEKRLLIIDEANVDKKEQYTLFKAITGQEKLSVNKKHKADYQVKNNLCLILLTNEATPMFLVEAERPLSDEENQFFMYYMERRSVGLNSDIKLELKERAGHYARTELRERAEAIFASGSIKKCRYTIPTPRTELMNEQFDNARSSLDYECDTLYKYCTEGYLVKDRLGIVMSKLGPYDVITASQLQNLIDSAKLAHNNIKSFRERMQSHGYLKRTKLRMNGEDAWEINPTGKERFDKKKGS